MSSDPTGRFDKRAENYALARPSYPVEMIDFFEDTFDLAPGRAVAEMGSGTGVLTGLLLDRGAVVHAVEPNDAMRNIAERTFAGRTSFHSIAATAEATGLPDGSVTWVVAAQAFHWFDAGKTAREVRRILEPGGSCALVWNARRTNETPFLRAYETFLQTWGTEYDQVKRSYENAEAIGLTLGPNYEQRSFANAQTLDRNGLRARILSTSYMPALEDPQAPKMLTALDRLCDQHAEDNTVRIEYDTHVYHALISE